MRLVLACLAVAALAGTVAMAQEGFPLKGSWLGDWGPNTTMRTRVFLVMDWDGKSISGVINSGTDNIPINNASLTPPTPAPPGVGGTRGGGGATPGDWHVHFEADARDRSGATVRYVVDGKVENIGLANRSIVGTWTVGTTRKDFRLVRQ